MSTLYPAQGPLLFLGSPEEALIPLKKLHSLGIPLAVVSRPPRPQGRGLQLKASPVAQYATSHGLRLFQPEKAGDPEFLKEIQQIAPQLAITVAYGAILPASFLALPRCGTVNIHPSLLPSYRGATPVPETILAGDKEGGVSLLWTVQAMDAGPIIAQKSLPLSGQETAQELLIRLIELGTELLVEHLTPILKGQRPGLAQEPSRVSFCRKIEKDQGKISWKASQEVILRRARALHPWPGVFTFLGEQRLVLESLSRCEESHPPGTAGELTVWNKNLHATAGENSCIIIQRCRLEGRKSVSGLELWNGLGSRVKKIRRIKV